MGIKSTPPPFHAWFVYRDLSEIQTDISKERLGVCYGFLSANNLAISTNDIAEGGSLNVKRKDLSQYPTPYKDVFLDMQTNKYLYAKITLATSAVEFEYSDSPPSGAGAITIADNSFQRIPLAFITSQKYVVDLRPIGGSGASSAIEPFTIFLTIDEENDSGSFTIWPGTINELLPTDMMSTFDYGLGNTLYVKLNVVTNGKAVTAATISPESTPTSPIATLQGSAPTTFGILIGVIANNTLFQVRTGNITASLVEALQEGKAVPSPGLSPYNFYYTWEITS